MSYIYFKSPFNLILTKLLRSSIFVDLGNNQKQHGEQICAHLTSMCSQKMSSEHILTG